MSATVETWDPWPFTGWTACLSLATERSTVHVFVSEEVCTSHWNGAAGFGGSCLGYSSRGDQGSRYLQIHSVCLSLSEICTSNWNSPSPPQVDCFNWIPAQQLSSYGPPSSARSLESGYK